jgi:NAD(P)-dependent dehydrogenase (short-subunit alcohol dehydrogenase family)
MTSAHGSLDGQNIVITGGSSGIGAALVNRFQASGARVAVLDLRHPPEAASDGVLRLTGDVTDEAAVDHAFGQVEDEFGSIDALVHCAAIEGPIEALTEVDVEEWRRVQWINLTGTFVVNRLVIRRMRERGRGQVVNFASSAGVELYPYQGPYNVSKAGVIALTKQFAKEAISDGVRVNCICPGPVWTPLIDEIIARDLSGASQHAREFQVDFAAMRENDDMWKPDEVLDLIVFLASPAASHVSGQFIRSIAKDDAMVYQ